MDVARGIRRGFSSFFIVTYVQGLTSRCYGFWVFPNPWRVVEVVERSAGLSGHLKGHYENGTSHSYACVKFSVKYWKDNVSYTHF